VIGAPCRCGLCVRCLFAASAPLESGLDVVLERLTVAEDRIFLVTLTDAAGELVRTLGTIRVEGGDWAWDDARADVSGTRAAALETAIAEAVGAIPPLCPCPPAPAADRCDCFDLTECPHFVTHAELGPCVGCGLGALLHADLCEPCWARPEVVRAAGAAGRCAECLALALAGEHTCADHLPLPDGWADVVDAALAEVDDLVRARQAEDVAYQLAADELREVG
jgi:hypothetical protein